MVLIPVRCLYCQSDQVTKGGKTAKGKQRRSIYSSLSKVEDGVHGHEKVSKRLASGHPYGVHGVSTAGCGPITLSTARTMRSGASSVGTAPHLPVTSLP